MSDVVKAAAVTGIFSVLAAVGAAVVTSLGTISIKLPSIQEELKDSVSKQVEAQVAVSIQSGHQTIMKKDLNLAELKENGRLAIGPIKFPVPYAKDKIPSVITAIAGFESSGSTDFDIWHNSVSNEGFMIDFRVNGTPPERVRFIWWSLPASN